MKRLPLFLLLCALPLLYSFSCDNSSPSEPQVEFTPSISPPGPICITPGESITFTGSGTPATAGPFAFEWTIPGVLEAVLGESTGPVTFPNAGTFVVTLVAWRTDILDGAEVTTNATVNVQADCAALAASVDSPSSSQVFDLAQSIAFTASATGGTAPYTWSWDFGDGSSSDLQNPPHAYAAEGTFTSTVTVTDAGGATATSSVTVLVQAGGLGSVFPTPVTGPDGLMLASGTFMNRSFADPTMLVFGSNGMAAFNYLALNFIYSLVDAVNYLGGVGMSYIPGVSGEAAKGVASTHALFGFNETSTWITYWDNAGGDFGPSRFFQGGGTDAVPYNNNPESVGFLFTQPTAVSAMEFDTNTSQYITTGSYGNFPGQVGTLISAFGRGSGKAFLAVSSGDATTPGQLYVHDGVPGTAATLVGDLALGPRKIRVLGDIAVITNFNDASISVATWDQSNNVTITDRIPVGPGPVGLDLVDLGGGQTGIVTANFTAGNVSRVTVSSRGRLVSQSTIGTTMDCSQPAHVLWVPNDNTKVAVTCFGSDKFVIVDSGL